MKVEPGRSLLDCLQQVPDPRGAQGRRFSLQAMLATIVCAVLSGARGFGAIAQWIHTQPEEIWYVLGYHRRPPTRNAFRGLLLALPPEWLEAALREWITSVLGQPVGDDALQAVSLDGKVLCGTLTEHGRAVHLLALLDQHTGCVLSQLPVPGDTNEAKAARTILRTLVLEGRVITGDAMFCQREVCQQIIDSGGHYLVVVKDNQPELKEHIAAEFQAAFSPLHGASTDRRAG